MAVSLNSFLGLNCKAEYKLVSSSSIGSSALKPTELNGFLGYAKHKKLGYCLSVVDSNRLLERVVTTTSSSSTSSGETTDGPTYDTEAVSTPDLDPLERNIQVQTSVSGNGSVVSEMPKQAASQSGDRKTPLTARERLKAGRMLNRYAESKPSKPEMGRKVLDALRESEKGKKRSRLPEAPTNLLDDSKRGMPKAGLTFQFPGGNDLLVIIFSFVFISTVMFATTFLVWKLGAIHFNEY